MSTINTHQFILDANSLVDTKIMLNHLFLDIERPDEFAFALHNLMAEHKLNKSVYYKMFLDMLSELNDIDFSETISRGLRDE